MNRFVFMGNYVEKNKDKNTPIYYDQVLDKFYSLPNDFFEKNKDRLEGTDEIFPGRYDDLYLKGYEITNQDEIKALKTILDFKKEKENIKEPETSSSSIYENPPQIVPEEEVSEEKKVKPYKKAIIGCIIALAACYLIYHEYTKYESAIKSKFNRCLVYTSPSPRDLSTARVPSSA